jgi:hypothetical protein
MKIGLGFHAEEDGIFPAITVENASGKIQYLEVRDPMYILLKDYGSHNFSADECRAKYQGLTTSDNKFQATGVLKAPDGAVYEFQDRWYIAKENTIQVDRKIRVKAQGLSEGYRTVLQFRTTSENDLRFHDFEYLMPPAFHKHNDLDYDGIPDWTRTYHNVIREDRLTAPMVMCYHLDMRICAALIRADLPDYDSKPIRERGERFFIQETDVGSLGFFWDKSVSPSQIVLEAFYPFYEGEKSEVLDFATKISCGAFAPSKLDSSIVVSYQIRLERATSFIDALWDLYGHLTELYHTTPPELPFSLSDANEYRLGLLERRHRKWEKTEDANEPAGFMINFHPTDGKLLGNVIEIGGFTGRNTELAYALLYFGYRKHNESYLIKARSVIEFAVKVCQLDNGFIHELYNVDKRTMDYWWVGALLPLNYAQTPEKLERLMGNTGERMSYLINELRKIKGNYFKTMCETEIGILQCYEVEKEHGVDHSRWLESAIKFGKFILDRQKTDGGWGRAYDTDGVELSKPAVLFGLNEHQLNSSTAAAIPFLVRLFKITREEKYLNAARIAGDYVLKEYVDNVEYCGGLMDAGSFLDGLAYDDEGITGALEGLLALYETTKENRFLDGAVKAAKLHSTWIYIWNVPLPEGSTLRKYDFKTTGWGVAICVHAGYVHEYPLFVVGELLRLSEITKDKLLFTFARLTALGEQQTLSSPAKMWNNASVGIQEEGYLVSWLDMDDTEWQKSEFGGWFKGEGNKTCLGWEYSVALCGAAKILDEYGTLDLDTIYQKIFGKD